MAKEKESGKKGSKTKKDSCYVCSVCGLVVTVDNICDCEVCDIICCEEEMKPKK